MHARRCSDDVVFPGNNYSDSNSNKGSSFVRMCGHGNSNNDRETASLASQKGTNRFIDALRVSYAYIRAPDWYAHMRVTKSTEIQHTVNESWTHVCPSIRNEGSASTSELGVTEVARHTGSSAEVSFD